MTPTKLWLNSLPKVKLIRLFGKQTLHVQTELSHVLRLPKNICFRSFEPHNKEHHATCNWVGISTAYLYEKNRTKCQILQPVRKGHVFHTLVELTFKNSFRQIVRQGHTYQTLVEFKTKNQTDKTFWKTKVACSNGVLKCVTPSKQNSASEVSSPILRSTMQPATGLA